MKSNLLRVTEVLLINRIVEAVGGTREYRIIVHRDSPWLVVQFDPSWGHEATPLNIKLEFGIWRSTLNVYRAGPDGAMPDDPVVDHAQRLTIEEIRKAMEDDIRASHA